MKTAATLPDIQTEGDIKKLVDTLCYKANNDTLLGPSFGAASRIHWPYFLTSQYRYWSTTLLGKKDIEGEPLPEQVVLPQGGHHVNHWLDLFSSTVEEYFSGSKAEEAKQLARQLATRLSATRLRELPVD
ncbi:group III truncated hemoglobin [Hymenobacter lutimineralis]|uniref:Group III truncated hemoglobin n=1 Tax=Hymenobacter lutimineralis TaxID=2606448 RepID=A0A5D6V2B1_9BACT|nr:MULTISPECIES: group III truncated hemoglobin [Hymenobacter]QIX61368.1 group III truncated hemoglobin [Hymenobacter sp. BT18]TYZ08929.1 group III truncated hemoglobin [Hymenobacter lutimineralis]